MSHAATNWAIKQRGIKPSSKIVLWHLCDRYHPDNGCFPSQETLAHDCEMSRASINRCIDELEEKGLVKRHPRINPKTKKQASTLYTFSFMDSVSQNETRGDLAVSQNDAEPCLKISDSRVSNCDTNSVKEPVKEPSTLTRLKGGEEVRDEILSILSKDSFCCVNAPAFHADVEASLKRSGMTVLREYPVKDRGDGRAGRVDLVVSCASGELIGIECDRAMARHKSVNKLKQLNYGIVALRESGTGEAVRDGIHIVHCGVDQEPRRWGGAEENGFERSRRILQEMRDEI